MPEGVTLTQLSQKVQAYSDLSRKDKELLIDHIRDNEMLAVVRASNSLKTTLHHPKYGHVSISVPPVADGKPMETLKMTKPVTPEELRKQAEVLLKAAQEAEDNASARNTIKKQLDPLKLEIFQAYGAMDRKFNELLDAMAEMEKALQKLKQLSF
ncbi:hypothetical protein [Martelella alba]|nr:hypothetical protein [Martelella alba]